MKKYNIQCPCCHRRSNSNKELNEYGIETLKFNEYIYQRCKECQDKPVTEHEKQTLKQI